MRRVRALNDRFGWAFWRARWFSIDTRSLGLFRIGFGLLLLSNLYDRAGGFDLVSFYSNDGILPNHYALFRPSLHGLWGLLFGFSSPGEVRVALGVVAAIYALYTLGLFTRLMQVLALICLESLNWRFQLIQHGGNVTTNLLAVWTLFLPLGERFSLDALRHSLRADPEADEGALSARTWRARPPKDYVALACFGLFLNWAFIYLFNAYRKDGVTWQDGSAVHYVLWQNRIATHLCAWLRMHEPFWLSPMLTWGTLVMEWSLPVLILTPVLQKWAHRVAFAFIWLLHGSIAALSTLGPFSYSMMAFSLLLVTRDDWELLYRWLRRPSFMRTVRYDRSQPLQVLTARTLARLDALDQLTFIERRGPFEVSRARQPGTHGLSALAQVSRALPLGPLYAWLWVVPLLNALVLAGAKLVAGRALEWEGLVRRKRRWVLQTALAAFLMACVGGQLLIANPGVPAWLKPDSLPPLLTEPIDYLQLPQGWRMFAPEAPRDDELLVVDALLSDGSHIDPLTGQPPDFDAPLHGPWYMNQHWCEVHGRLPGWRDHWRNFKDYLLRLPSLQGWPGDKRIIGFDVYVVTAKTPPPGSTTVSDVRREKLFDSNVQ